MTTVETATADLVRRAERGESVTLQSGASTVTVAAGRRPGTWEATHTPDGQRRMAHTATLDRQDLADWLHAYTARGYRE